MPRTQTTVPPCPRGWTGEATGLDGESVEGEGEGITREEEDGEGKEEEDEEDEEGIREAVGSRGGRLGRDDTRHCALPRERWTDVLKE